MPRATANSKMMMLTNPDSAVSEVFRTLKFNVEFSAIERGDKTIAILSANHGEGKTIIALNLAAAYAKAGKKVMVVDADLRKPAVHLAFHDDNSSGLTSYLAGHNDISGIIKPSHVDNLSLITSGPVTPNPSEMLDCERMNALLLQLKQLYDVILIDTPPALALTDARIMATKSDSALLVVDHGKLKRTAAKKLHDDLTHLKVNLLGVVFNKTNSNDADMYLYHS